MGLQHSSKKKSSPTVHVVVDGDMPQHLEGASVVAATSITQSSEQTPQQMVAELDLLFQQKVKHIEILAGDTAQIANVPLMLFQDAIKSILERLPLLKVTKIKQQVFEAREQLNKNVIKVKQHFEGLKQLIADLGNLTFENIEAKCRKNGVLLADDDLMKMLIEKGSEWSGEVKEALERRFKPAVLDCFVSFEAWDHRRGNPLGDKMAKKQFIDYLRFLQPVYKDYYSDTEKYASYRASVKRHAEIISIERCKGLDEQLIEFYKHMAKPNGKPSDDGLIPAVFRTQAKGATVEGDYGLVAKMLKAFRTRRVQLESAVSKKSQVLEEEKSPFDSFVEEYKTVFDVCATITGYGLETAIEFSEEYLLGEFAIFGQFRSECKRALRKASEVPVDFFVYNGKITSAVQAYFETCIAPIKKRDKPAAQWLPLKFHKSLSSKQMSERKSRGQSFSDEAVDELLSQKADAILQQKRLASDPANMKRGGLIMQYPSEIEEREDDVASNGLLLFRAYAEELRRGAVFFGGHGQNGQVPPNGRIPNGFASAPIAILAEKEKASKEQEEDSDDDSYLSDNTPPQSATTSPPTSPPTSQPSSRRSSLIEKDAAASSQISGAALFGSSDSQLSDPPAPGDAADKKEGEESRATDSHSRLGNGFVPANQ